MFKSPVINYFILKIVTYSNSYIKGDKYFFSYKSRCGKWAPETKLFTKQSRDTIQKDHIYYTNILWKDQV